jgi:hypothetical protein
VGERTSKQWKAMLSGVFSVRRQWQAWEVLRDLRVARGKGGKRVTVRERRRYFFSP